MNRMLLLSAVLLVPINAQTRQPGSVPVIQIIPISHFGAKGDGRTDDTLSFISAVTTAGKIGAQIKLESKTYLLKSTLQIPPAKKAVSIVGSGHATLLFAPDRPLNNGIFIAGNSGVELKSFTLLGSGAGLHNAISVRGASNVHLDHLRIAGIHGTGASALSAISLASVNQIWITHSTITDVGLGPGRPAFAIWNYFKARTEHIYIGDNTISGNTLNIAIGLFDTDHAIVENNIIDGGDNCVNPCTNNGYGILFYRTAVNPSFTTNTPIAIWPTPIDETIIGNQITNTAGSGIYLQGVHGATVAKNTIANTSLRMNDVSLPAGGIALNASNDVRIMNNNISDSMKGGIVLATTKDVLIDGNQIHDAKMWGIRLRVAQVQTTIRRNTIDGAPIGISIEKDAIGTDLEDNVLDRKDWALQPEPAP